MATFRYTNAKADLTGTSLTTIYTVPAKSYAIISSILVSEDSGNADTITVSITDAASSPATFSVFKTKAISANATAELLSRDLVLKASEILKVQAATADRLHVIVSLREYYTGIA
jgi:phosphopantetheine adenylyltransferase|tara:strand:- start:2137 stop:2481 length:345 start_codon:yes stop_codon:yes gene_type:complete